MQMELHLHLPKILVNKTVSTVQQDIALFNKHSYLQISKIFILDFHA